MIRHERWADTVHGGSLRSSFDETSEALFLTQGYLYDTMEAAEARFKGDDPGFIYSRYSNPTVSMFEKRMALLEEYSAARPKRLRLLIFNTAGRIIHHARRVVCRISGAGGR